MHGPAVTDEVNSMADETKIIPAVQPLAGQTTADDKMVFEPERLSYESARQIAAIIAVELQGRDKAQRIVIAGLSTWPTWRTSAART